MSKLQGVTTLIVVLAAAIAIASLVLNILIYTKVNSSDDDKVVTTTEFPPEQGCNSITNPPSSDQGWKDAADRLLAAIDPSADPCEDFYQFACGKYIAETDLQGQSRAGTYDETQHNINRDLGNYFKNLATAPTTDVDKLQKRFMDICVEDGKNNHSLPAIYQPFLTKFQDDLKATIGFPLTGLVATKPLADFNAIFGMMGTMQRQYSGGPFLTSLATSDYGDNTKNALYVSQPALPMARDFYVLPQFMADLQAHTDDVAQTLKAYLDANKITAITFTDIYGDSDGNSRCADATKRDACVVAVAEYVVGMERQIAMASWPDTEMRNYEQQYNPYTLEDLTKAFPGIGLADYVKGFVPAAGDDGFSAKIVIVQPTYFYALNNLFESGNVKVADILNFLAVSFIVENTGAMSLNLGRNQKLVNGKLPRVDVEARRYIPYPERRGRGARRISRRPHNARLFTLDPEEETTVNCYDNLVNFAPFASGYSYMQQTAEATDIQADVTDQTARIIAAFKDQIDSLDWMTAETKAAAHAKSEGLKQNFGWPTWYSNAATVNAYHKNYAGLINLDGSATMWEAYKALMYGFETTETTDLLTQPGDRLYFLMSPAIVNAWYQPERNSITFPLGILNPPYYNLHYPQAYNYAGQGGSGGHELTHGYDDEGIQFGPDGQLTGSTANYSSKCTYTSCGIMDDESRVGFTDMAQCVVTQYNMQCCPLKSGNVRCANGLTTQGENIADIGGQLSAYNAYGSLVSTKLGGGEAPLPGLEQYSLKQIFWITYGVSWCMKITDERLQKQLMTDPHSPSYCRVNQVMQDLPQFGRDFRCKRGVSPMYPTEEDRCRVWTGF